MVDTLLQFLAAWGTSCEAGNLVAEVDFDGDCLAGASDLLQLLADFATGNAPDAGEPPVSRIGK